MVRLSGAIVSMAGVLEVGGEQWQSERSPAKRLLQPHRRHLKANPPEVSLKQQAVAHFHSTKHQRKSPHRRRLVCPPRSCETNVRLRSQSRLRGAHSLRSLRADLEKRTKFGPSPFDRTSCNERKNSGFPATLRLSSRILISASVQQPPRTGNG